MSTLFVNNLNTASGTTITIPTGKKLIGTDAGGIIAPGMILQTIMTSKTTQASTTVTDLSNPVDYLSATITPKFSSSTILVRGSLNAGGDAAGIGVNIFIKAGGSFMTTSELGNNQAGLLDYGFGRSSSGTSYGSMFSFEVLDSPATTNAFTYTIAFGRYGGSGTAYVGWHNNKSRSSLTLMEIAE